MERLDNKCPGDCSTCELLANGVIKSMIACAIDQIFQRQIRLQKEIEDLKELLAKQQEVSLVNFKENEGNIEENTGE